MRLCLFRMDPRTEHCRTVITKAMGTEAGHSASELKPQNLLMTPPALLLDNVPSSQKPLIRLC